MTPFQTKLSSRLNGVQESATLKMNAKVKELTSQGHKIINLTAGEPDFPVLAPLKQAAIDAIEQNFSKYTPVAGIPELRKAISKKLEKQNQLSYSPEQVIVTVGAKQAIFNFFLATLDPGSEVIIPSPYWVSYPDMVRIAGGTPVIVETTAESGFKMSAEQLKAALTANTRVVIINSPSNPTGAFYSRDELDALADVLEKTNAWVVSDEIYEKLTYEGKFYSFASLSNDAFERTLTVNGLSKTYAMTGWRVGYAAGPKPVIAAMALLQGQSTSNTNSVAQKAALRAFELDDEAIKPMVEALRRRRDRMVEIFSQDHFFSFVKPSATFYFFLNIEAALGKRYNEKEVIQGSDDFAFYLLNSAHVGTVAGKGFGADSYLRISFAASDEEVRQGAEKIVEAAAKLV